MKEVWRDIRGYKGLYQVSNLGRVRSLDRVVWNPKSGYTKRKGVLLRQAINKSGYWVVAISKDGKQKTFIASRLVLKAFAPKVKGKNECNHKDGNKRNNRVENLEWCTHSENMKHSSKEGLIKRSIPIKHINTGKIYVSTREAARITGISQRSICRSIHQNSTICKNHKFSKAG